MSLSCFSPLANQSNMTSFVIIRWLNRAVSLDGWLAGISFCFIFSASESQCLMVQCLFLTIKETLRNTFSIPEESTRNNLKLFAGGPSFMANKRTWMNYWNYWIQTNACLILSKLLNEAERDMIGVYQWGLYFASVHTCTYFFNNFDERLRILTHIINVG